MGKKERKPFTDEQKQHARDALAKGREIKRLRRELGMDNLAGEGNLAQVASVEGAPKTTKDALLAKIANLEAKLAESEQKRSEHEKSALASAQAQGALLQREIQEVPTGKTVMLPRCSGYKVVGHHDDGREILKPLFERRAIPTFFYKIDMPPVGGTDLKLNGTPYYHGAVYEFDLDTLRSVKEIVYRLWRHEADISGSNENFYRKEQRPVLSARL